MTPNGALDGQYGSKGPQGGPRVLQDGSKKAQVETKRAPRWPRLPPDGPKVFQDGPKMHPRCLHDGPKVSKEVQNEPVRRQETSKGAMVENVEKYCGETSGFYCKIEDSGLPLGTLGRSYWVMVDHFDFH